MKDGFFANQKDKFSFADLVGYASSQMNGSNASMASQYTLTVGGSDHNPRDSWPPAKRFRLWRSNSRDSAT